MWANSVWGFFGLAVTFMLAPLGLAPEYAWLARWFMAAAITTGSASIIILLWPFIGKRLKLSGPFILMALGLVLFLCGLAWKTMPIQRSMQTNSKGLITAIAPSALDMFQEDAAKSMNNTNDINSVLHADTFLEFPNSKNKIHVLYKIVLHINQNTKYYMFYVPNNELYVDSIYALPHLYQKLVADAEKNSVGFGGAEINGIVRSEHLNFSGRIFVYCDLPLDIQQQAAMDKSFKDHGANFRYRGPDYLVSIWDLIRRGYRPEPDHYIFQEQGPPLKK